MVAPVSLFGPFLLSSSAANYTVGGSGTVVYVGRILFTSVDSATQTVTVKLTRSGGSQFTLMNAVSIASGGDYIANELAGLVLNSGDSLALTATGNINAVGSGFE